MKNFLKLLILWGAPMGGKAPQGIKMGIYKPKA